MVKEFKVGDFVYFKESIISDKSGYGYIVEVIRSDDPEEIFTLGYIINVKYYENGCPCKTSKELEVEEFLSDTYPYTMQYAHEVAEDRIKSLLEELERFKIIKEEGRKLKHDDNNM